jgi:glycosyltransferase involved in cell wall biosynthesis
MKISHLSAQALDLMRYDTGIVIPVFFPEHVETYNRESLLRDTVLLYAEQVSDPAKICLSVDGEQFGAEVVKQVAQEFKVSSHVSSVNRGKLQASANGVRYLLEQQSLKYIAVVDQDGDHFANELLNFIRAAQHIVDQADTDQVLILGRRISRHRPMGYLRGELEELCDRVLLDALAYNAALTQRPLHLEFAVTLDEFPDFHSGYKLFSNSTAVATFLSEPKQMGVSDTCYYRHAVEAVMVVEALMRGAYLGVVNRSTFNEQPISTFGSFNRIHMTADQIIWPCKRLDIPLPFVKQWLANHISRLMLNTLVPDGQTELEQVRQMVITTLADGQAEEIPPPVKPLFV